MHQEIEANNEVKFIRLNSGEDLITEVSFIDDQLVLINPLKIIYKQDALVMAFSPWIYFSICDNQEFPLISESVLTIQNPTKEIINYYKDFIRKLTEARSHFDEGDFAIVEKNPPKQDEVEHLTEAEEEYLREFLENLDKGSKRKLH